ncbi:MAG: hypothetical protein ABUK08_00365 [Candidatus Humimicrobiaceae bacterium]
MIGHHMTDKGTIIDQEKLMKSYIYNPYHGTFYAIKSRERIKTKEYKNGYQYGEFFGDYFRIDKLVVLWLTGVYPKKVLHKNRNLADNHWYNLSYPLVKDKSWFKSMRKKGFIVSIEGLD